MFDAQEDAFGAPGAPGDAVRIEHFADWILNAYEDLLDWQAELRAFDCPEEFELTVELASRAADEPLAQMRSFLEDTISATKAIPAHLEKSEAGRIATPLTIEATLVVSVDNDLMAEALGELRRALGLPEGDDE